MQKKNYLDNDYIDLDKYNKSTGTTPVKFYCVIRVQNKKIKNAAELKKFEMHMQRKLNVLNADPAKKNDNKIIIGNEFIFNNTMKYIEGIKLRKNVNIGRDLILTSSNDFFNTIGEKGLNKWIDENKKFLINKFGDNCIYACVHMDETTPHIHALIVAKFYDEKRDRYVLSSNRYFDGIDKLKNLQDDYADHMTKEFNNLKRGIRGSKAKHMDIKQYYSIINSKLNENDKNSIMAHAKKSYLHEKRIAELEETIESQKKLFQEKEIDKKNVIEKLRNVNKNNKIYIKTIKTLAEKYNISKDELINIIDSIEIEK